MQAHTPDVWMCLLSAVKTTVWKLLGLLPTTVLIFIVTLPSVRQLASITSPRQTLTAPESQFDIMLGASNVFV